MVLKIGSVYNVRFGSGNTHTAFSWPSKIPDSGNKYMKNKVIKITKKLNPKDSLDYDYVGDIYDKIDGAIELKNIKIVSKQLILKSSTFKVAGKRKKSKKRTQKKSKRKNTKKRTQKKRTQKKSKRKNTKKRTQGRKYTKMKGGAYPRPDVLRRVDMRRAEEKRNEEETEQLRTALRGREAEEKYREAEAEREGKELVKFKFHQGYIRKDKKGHIVANITGDFISRDSTETKPRQIFIRLTRDPDVVSYLNDRNLFAKKNAFLRQIKKLTEYLLPKYANFRDPRQMSSGLFASHKMSNSVHTPKKVIKFFNKENGLRTRNMTFCEFYEFYTTAEGSEMTEGGVVKLLEEWLSYKATQDTDTDATTFLDDIIRSCTKNPDRFIKFEKLARDAVEFLTKGFNMRVAREVYRHMLNFELRGIAITCAVASRVDYPLAIFIFSSIMKTLTFMLSDKNPTQDGSDQIETIKLDESLKHLFDETCTKEGDETRVEYIKRGGRWSSNIVIIQSKPDTIEWIDREAATQMAQMAQGTALSKTELKRLIVELDEFETGYVPKEKFLNILEQRKKQSEEVGTGVAADATSVRSRSSFTQVAPVKRVGLGASAPPGTSGDEEDYSSGGEDDPDWREKVRGRGERKARVDAGTDVSAAPQGQQGLSDGGGSTLVAAQSKGEIDGGDKPPE